MKKRTKRGIRKALRFIASAFFVALFVWMLNVQANKIIYGFGVQYGLQQCSKYRKT